MKKTTIVITDESITVTHENENGQTFRTQKDIAIDQIVDEVLKNDKAWVKTVNSGEIENNANLSMKASDYIEKTIPKADLVIPKEPKSFKTEKEVMTYAARFVAQARYADALEFLEGKKKAFGTTKVLAAIAELKAIVGKESVVSKEESDFEPELPQAVKKGKPQTDIPKPTVNMRADGFPEGFERKEAKNDFDEIVKDEIETTDDDGFDYGTEDNEEQIFGK